MRIHAISGILLVVTTFSFSILPITYQGKELLLHKKHRVIGFSLSMAVIPIFIGGFFIKFLKEYFSEYRISKILTLGLFHKTFSYFLICFSHYNMTTGIKSHNMWIFYTYLFIIVIIMLVLELRFRKWLK